MPPRLFVTTQETEDNQSSLVSLSTVYAIFIAMLRYAKYTLNHLSKPKINYLGLRLLVFNNQYV